jgi:hypothetical protein
MYLLDIDAVIEILRGSGKPVRGLTPSLIREWRKVQ